MSQLPLAFIAVEPAYDIGGPQRPDPQGRHRCDACDVGLLLPSCWARCACGGESCCGGVLETEIAEASQGLPMRVVRLAGGCGRSQVYSVERGNEVERVLTPTPPPAPPA